jgi:hypothetical protein
MRAALSHTITIPKCPKLALCVSLSSAFSRSLKTTPPRRAAESTMRRQPLCQASHQHRKHAIIFICVLSAARLYIIYIQVYTTYKVGMRARFARRQKVNRERDSFGQIGAQGVRRWINFLVFSRRRESWARADAPLALVDIHTCFLLSRPCTRVLMINDAQAWCWCWWQAATTHPRLCFLSSRNNGPESFSQHAAFLFEYYYWACVV